MHPTVPEAASTHIRSARLQTLYDYWQAKRLNRPMPSRADIDPIEIQPSLLPYLLLVEVVDNGRRFRYRLAGTAFREIAGVELTGRYVDEILPGSIYSGYIVELHREAVATRRPIYSESAHVSPTGGVERFFRRLMLPLSVDGISIDMVLAGEVFDRPRFDLTRSTLQQGEFREEVRLLL
ncbi:MAG TPA: PAS domain-containing protein [Alphaproteobacteria bacterium]|nr:PAS domain-containing protein [Alphaproteobacteria bacterium]